MPAPLIATADAKSHLRVFHTQDDTYIASLVTAVVMEWERVTHTSLTAGTQFTSTFSAMPDDRILRVYVHPVDTGTAVIGYTDAAGSPATGGDASHWSTLDGYSQYVVSDAEADAWHFADSAGVPVPVTLTYTSGVLASDVRMALLLRIGFFYSFRGDDVSPPNQDAWLMLAARHRTGALL